MTVPLALLTIGGLLLAAGGAQAASPTHYPVMMKRLSAIPAGTTVQTTARQLFPHGASDASGYRTMAARVDSGSVSKFTAAIATCAAGGAGETGVKRLAQLVGHGQRSAAVQAVTADVGACIDTTVPPMQRLQAKAAQRPLTDAVLWVELKMAAR